MKNKNEKLLLYLQYIALLELKTKDYKVFLYILPKLSFYKYKNISQKEISDELGLSKSDVSKAINSLIICKIMILNPDSIYKNKKKDVKLNDYSVDELGDMIFELIEENSSIPFYDLADIHITEDVE